MKKVISLFFAGVFMFSLTACSSAAASSSTETVSAAESESASSENSSVEVEKKLLTVDITLPASMFSSGDDAASEEAVSGEEVADDEASSNETPEEYCERMKKEDGILNAVSNADGSVTLTMTKTKHSKMMDEIKQSIDETIQNTLNDGTFSSLKEVTYNDDASVFTVKVDREAFEGSWDGFSAVLFAFSGAAYQYYGGNQNPYVEIDYVDIDTGDLIDSSIYPDDFQSDDTGEEAPAE